MTALLADVATGHQCCGRDVRHCHGTHVVHLDGTEECTEPGCDVPGEGHVHLVTCLVVEPPCRCA